MAVSCIDHTRGFQNCTDEKFSETKLSRPVTVQMSGVEKQLKGDLTGFEARGTQVSARTSRSPSFLTCPRKPCDSAKCSWAVVFEACEWLLGSYLNHYHVYAM